MGTYTRVAIIAGTTLVLGGAAAADTVQIGGNMGASTENLADFTGSITYNTTMGNMGQLLIELTNTTNAATGGFLTAFVFNINSTDTDASAELLSGPASFQLITNANAEPFGTFDAGASTSADFLGGGSPNTGLGVGETGMFEFKITADDAAALSAADFITDGPFEFNFIARFRGLANDGSDKVPGEVDGNGPVIPLPTTGAMGAAGLVLLAMRRRRG